MWVCGQLSSRKRRVQIRGDDVAATRVGGVRLSEKSEWGELSFNVYIFMCVSI